MNLVKTLPKFHPLSLYLALIMVILSITAFALRPNERMSEQKQQFNLEAMIPQQFGDWKEDEASNGLLVDPSVAESVNKVYLQSLSRSYINSKGQRVMLAIAYGGDQNDMLQVHKPEICYTAQGFYVEKSHDSPFSTDFGSFTVRKMVAVKGSRQEPVTYWVTIGNKVAVNPIQWRLERIRYGLTGVVPDGLLFRVSTIGDNIDDEYSVQQQFVTDLMNKIAPDARERLLGVKDGTF
ncbi:MAG: exosortase-associated protein EpsI, B-type [Methylophilus sp.]|uniref:exosortase-associated protein EpsI, B-type n=1 Tax=Methylophilus sp. TaxID=29541 RepID=UPI003FA0B5DF